MEMALDSTIPIQFHKKSLCKSEQVWASLCKSVQVCANLCKSVQVRASLCKSVQVRASPCKSVQVLVTTMQIIFISYNHNYAAFKDWQSFQSCFNWSFEINLFSVKHSPKSANFSFFLVSFQYFLTLLFTQCKIYTMHCWLEEVINSKKNLPH